MLENLVAPGVAITNFKKTAKKAAKKVKKKVKTRKP
jgi:hypothetical protein